MLRVFAVELPRFYKLSWKGAVCMGAKTVQFLCGVLWSFENDFGNEILQEYVYILVLYAVDELCLTLDGVRIFIWPCN